MGIRLATLGSLRVFANDTALERPVAQRSRAALFVYLTIERRVSRDAVMAMFWPESEAGAARHALRQSLYHLRNSLGGVEWIAARGHELVVQAGVAADATAFDEAMARGDVERAMRLYSGPFLDGVHLVALQPWESWVDHRRTRYARLFRRACRVALDARLTARDFAGAIAVAERWTASDPTDDEAQHRLIAALAAAGERTDALRQYESYARVLAPDGLEPLDETRTLVDQLRARPAMGSWGLYSGNSSAV
jgi:DNA-binding SARP family transcriptional activator